jgi:hypothetical protein
VTEEGALVGAEVDGAVESLYEDYLALVTDLRTSSPSGLAALNRSYHKHLLVAAASSLEDQVKSLLPQMFTSYGTEELGTFVAKQVAARGYAGLFDWKTEKATPFFSSFGVQCGKRFKALLNEDDDLREQHDAFMRLGNFRNLVVHSNYATYAIDMTPEAVIDLYRKAVKFVERFEDLTVATRSANPDSAAAAPSEDV